MPAFAGMTQMVKFNVIRLQHAIIAQKKPASIAADRFFSIPYVAI
jgi:hypothetical protein